MDRSSVVVTSEKQYTELTAVTWNFQNPEKDVDHCLLGISSELGELETAVKKHVGYGKELDIVNIKEEIGDLLFYIFRLSSFKGIELIFSKCEVISHNPPGYIEPSQTTMLYLLENTRGIRNFSCALDDYELNIAESKEQWERYCLTKCIIFTKRIMNFFNIDESEVFEIMTTNIRKLAVRFPDKFDSFLASNRDLETERKILEAGEGQ